MAESVREHLLAEVDDMNPKKLTVLLAENPVPFTGVVGKLAGLPFFGSGQTVAILQAPSRCVFATAVPGQTDLVSPDGVPEDTFEATLFNDTFEARWVHRTGENLGDLAVLFEGEADAPSGWVFGKPVEYADTRDSHYILWGQPLADRGPLPGWTMLGEQQAGPFAAPLEVPPECRAVLKYREYLAVADDHGNMAVAAQRLRRLDVER
jgi:CRISPR-associated protein (TIGR03984 family)